MNGVIFAIFTLCVYKAAADFGPWSAYGPCQCDSQEYRSRVCDAEPCTGAYTEGQACACTPFVPASDCPMVAGADSVYGIVADPCDCRNYIQCEYNSTLAQFIGLQRACNPCELWNQEVLTCVRDPSKPNCVFQPSTEATGDCPLAEVVGQPTQFYLGNETVECAPGTKFNLTQCTCIRIVPYVNELEGITCLSFDSSVASASQGLYVYNQNVQQATTDCKSGNCAFFNSTALSKLELAYFSNAFDQFTGFSVSFFYKRLTSSGSRSLLDNSECSLAASLSITSNAGSVSSLISNSTQATSTSTETSADDAWHHYVLSYDGNTVSTYLDKALVKTEVLGGKIDRVKAPLVIGANVCGGASFFDGYLDTVSVNVFLVNPDNELTFIKGSLDAVDVASLNDNPSQCLP